MEFTVAHRFPFLLLVGLVSQLPAEPVGLATVGTPRHDRGRCRNVVWVVRDDNGIRRDSINEFVERVTWPQH